MATIERFKKDIWQEYTFRHTPKSNENNIKQLYIANKHCQPKPAFNSIESAANSFAQQLQQENKNFPQKSLPNINQLQKYALQKLINYPELLILQADKNMGVCILNHDMYIK